MGRLFVGGCVCKNGAGWPGLDLGHDEHDDGLLPDHEPRGDPFLPRHVPQAPSRRETTPFLTWIW